MTATIEYLLVSVVAFALISISVAALLNIREFSEYSLDQYRFKSDAVTLRNAIKQVCVLGNGNSREVDLKGRIAIDSGHIRNGRNSLPLDVPCDVEETGLEGKIIVKNTGKIEFR
ncbi:hypothetical protein JXA56_04265 [Candidatus Micrarchaeota archaeon]|nr:hypothetical protein [Candidatus Micrarchaeota archaeon]